MQQTHSEILAMRTLLVAAATISGSAFLWVYTLSLAVPVYRLPPPQTMTQFPGP